MIFVAAFAMYDFKPVYKYKFTRVSFLTCRFLIESRSSALSLHLPETQNEYLIKVTHCIPTKFLVQERFVPRARKNYLIKLIRSSTFFETLKKYYLSFVKFIEMIGRATMRIFQFSRSDESNIKPLSLSLSLSRWRNFFAKLTLQHTRQKGGRA